MNFKDWYTDSMDIYRVTPQKVGSITKHIRELVAASVPCRIYRSGKAPISMQDTAAKTAGSNKLMCGIEVDLRSGDELHIRRGGGREGRYFAGGIQGYPEPFGAVLPGLAHKEADILKEARA